MWSPVIPPESDSAHPSSRCKHAMCLYRGSIYLYGGRDGNRSLKDLWQYNLGTDKWIERKTKGEKPGCLEEHTLLAYKGFLYIFGGEFSFVSRGEIPLWILNIDSLTWEKPQINSEVLTPSGRRGHTAVMCNNAMHIYGGYIDLKGSNSEFWSYHFESKSWHLNYSHQSVPDGPGARHCHSAVIYDNAMWIYGGMNDLNTKGDFWKWNFEFKRWSRIRTKPSPPDLQGHTSCKVSDGILLFGGESDGDLSNEIWKYHFRTQAWVKVQVQGVQPPSRTRHVSLLVTALHMNLIESNMKEAHATTKKDSKLAPNVTDSSERSLSAPYLKKSAAVEIENRPYSSPPVIPSESPTNKMFHNKIDPNFSDANNDGKFTEPVTRMKGWEINKEQFCIKPQKEKESIEMTELVPLLRNKIPRSSTFESCDSIRGIENLGYRKSSDGSLIGNAWDDAQVTLAQQCKRSGSMCNSLNALKEQETNFDEMVLTGDSCFPRENYRTDYSSVCDNCESLDVAKCNNFDVHSGRGIRFSNVYQGNLIDLNTVIQNPDPQLALVDTFLTPACEKVGANAQNLRLENIPNFDSPHMSSTETSSSNTPTESGHDSTPVRVSNHRYTSPSSPFRSNLPGVVKSGSLDSMKQLKLLRMHATHLSNSSSSDCNDDVFLEDIESTGDVTDDENTSSEEAQLLRKSITKLTNTHIEGKRNATHRNSELKVDIEKEPLISKGQRSRSISKDPATFIKETEREAGMKKQDVVSRQMTAPSGTYKNENGSNNNSVSVMFTFGGRELEAQNIGTKPMSVWKYTFREEIMDPFYDSPKTLSDC